MSNYIVIKKSETDSAEVSMCNDGIIRVMFKKNTDIGPSEFEELFEKYNALVEGKRYPYLYTIEDSSVTFTNEGRTYAKEKEFSFPKICNAYVAKSLAHKLVANFYLKFNKPSYPSKVFATIEDAEAWCLQQLKDSNEKHYSMVI